MRNKLALAAITCFWFGSAAAQAAPLPQPLSGTTPGQPLTAANPSVVWQCFSVQTGNPSYLCNYIVGATQGPNAGRMEFYGGDIPFVAILVKPYSATEPQTASQTIYYILHPGMAFSMSDGVATGQQGAPDHITDHWVITQFAGKPVP